MTSDVTTALAHDMHIGRRPDDLAACRADPLRLAARPRLYGIGPGKTGTNVLASMFTGLIAERDRRHCEPLASRLFPEIRGGRS